jgi:U4/U6.U5 tri-snRNP component SNU23
MRVERVDVSKVRSRLQQVKKDEEARKAVGPKKPALKEYEDRLQEQEEEAEKRRKELKERREAARREQLEAQKEEEGQEEEGLDPELAAAMGFAGFGGSKK